MGVDLGVESPTSHPAGTDTRPLSICTPLPLKASALAIAHSMPTFGRQSSATCHENV